MSSSPVLLMELPSPTLLVESGHPFQNCILLNPYCQCRQSSSPTLQPETASFLSALLAAILAKIANSYPHGPTWALLAVILANTAHGVSTDTAGRVISVAVAGGGQQAAGS